MNRTSNGRLELELELNRPGRLVPPGTEDSVIKDRTELNRAGQYQPEILVRAGTDS